MATSVVSTGSWKQSTAERSGHCWADPRGKVRKPYILPAHLGNRSDRRRPPGPFLPSFLPFRSLLRIRPPPKVPLPPVELDESYFLTLSLQEGGRTVPVLGRPYPQPEQLIIVACHFLQTWKKHWKACRAATFAYPLKKEHIVFREFGAFFSRATTPFFPHTGNQKEDGRMAAKKQSSDCLLHCSFRRRFAWGVAAAASISTFAIDGRRRRAAAAAAQSIRS